MLSTNNSIEVSRVSNIKLEITKHVVGLYEVSIVCVNNDKSNL
jgi:hypothetical protein